MLQVAHILCLVAPGSAAPAQALHLAQRLDATLHVMPDPLSTDVETQDHRIDLSSESSESAVSLRRPTDPPTSFAEMQQYVTEESIDFVVADTPADRGPVPPLAAEGTRRLVRHLPCPVFVVEHEERPTAMQEFLVPTDLSDPSLRAFRHAVTLAHLYDAAVHVLHVVDSLPYVALTPTDRLSLGRRSLPEHRGRRQVRAFLKGEAPGDVPLHLHLAYGDPADQILRFLDRTGVDLLVLSSHGTEGPSEVPLGPVPTRVMGRMTCPSFLVRAVGDSLLAPSAGGEDGLPPE